MASWDSYSKPTLKDATIFSEESFLEALLVVGPEPFGGGHNLTWLQVEERSAYETSVRIWAIGRYGDNVLADHFPSQFHAWQARQRANNRRAECLRKMILRKR